MKNNAITQLQAGMETAFIDRNTSSNLAYKPQFISNNYKEGRKVLSSIESYFPEDFRLNGISLQNSVQEN